MNLSDQEEKIKQNRQTLELQEGQRIEIENQKVNLNKEIEETKGEIEKFHGNKKDAEIRMNELKDQLKDMEFLFNQKIREIADLDKKIAETQDGMAKAKADYEKIEQKRASSEAKITEAEANLDRKSVV